MLLEYCSYLALVLALCFYPGFAISLPPSDTEEGERAGLENNAVQRIYSQNHSKNAYVTLIDSDFDLGAQVLGLSLQDTGTSMDRVALCTEAVSAKTKEALKAGGWSVKEIQNIPNPHKDEIGVKNHSGFSKLYVWNMTEYERIIYLDSNVLILSNIDHLFDCGTFCAAFRDTDMFNSGVMVVEPSSAVFKDMRKEVPFLPSYNGGDQGFFNEYFKNVIHAPFFNWSDTRRQHQPMRMPSGFNAETGQYYCLNKWLIPENRMWVINYCFGKLRPWLWWESRVFDMNWKWTSVRQRLPKQCDHHGGDVFLHHLYWLPYLILILLCFTLHYYNCSLNGNASKKLKYFDSFNQRFSRFVPLPLLFLCYYLAFAVVPTTMLPSNAEYILWLWTSFFLLIFLGAYCRLCHAITASKSQDPSHNTTKKMNQTFMLFGTFTASHITLLLIPEATSPFLMRMEFLPVLLAIHLVICQVAGLAVIRVWSGSCTPYCHQQEKEEDLHMSKLPLSNF